MLTTNDAECSTKSHLRKSRWHLNFNETVCSAANLSLSVVHTESSLNLGGQELRILTQMEWLLEHQIDTWLFTRETSAIYSEAKSRGLPLMAANFRASCNPILTRRINIPRRSSSTYRPITVRSGYFNSRPLKSAKAAGPRERGMPTRIH
jgi:hypothetical protein